MISNCIRKTCKFIFGKYEIEKEKEKDIELKNIIKTELSEPLNKKISSKISNSNISKNSSNQTFKTNLAVRTKLSDNHQNNDTTQNIPILKQRSTVKEYFDFKNFLIVACIKNKSDGWVEEKVFIVKHIMVNSNFIVKILKILNPIISPTESVRFVYKLELLKKINEDYISKILSFNTHFDTTCIFINFNFAGNLKILLKEEKKFSEERVKLYAAEIIRGLETLHSKDICYGILKPDDIFIDKEGFISLYNFELSKIHF